MVRIHAVETVIRQWISMIISILLIAAIFFVVGKWLIPEETEYLLSAYRLNDPAISDLLTDNILTPYAALTALLLFVSVFLLRLMVLNFDMQMTGALKIALIRDCTAALLMGLMSVALILKGYGKESLFVGPAILTGNAVAMWLLIILFYRDKKEESLAQAIGSLVYPLFFIGIGYWVSIYFPDLRPPSVFVFLTEILVIYLFGMAVEILMYPERQPGEKRFWIFFKSWIKVLAAYFMAHLLTWIVLFVAILIGMLVVISSVIINVLGGLDAESIEISAKNIFCSLLVGAGDCSKGIFPMLLAPVIYATLFIVEKFRLAITTSWGWIPLLSFLMAFYSRIRRSDL